MRSFEDHLSGICPLDQVDSYLNKRELSRKINAMGFREKTHVWVKGYGYKKKLDHPFWASVADLKHGTMASLAETLGLTESTLRRIIKGNDVIVKRYSHVGSKFSPYKNLLSKGSLTQNSEKRAKTLRAKLGPNWSRLLKEKADQTLRDRYGVDSLCDEVFRKKQEETNLARYGVKYPLQNPGVRDKVRETMLEKYGVENPSQNEDLLNRSVAAAVRTRLARGWRKLNMLLEIAGYQKLSEEVYRGTNSDKAILYYEVQHKCGNRFKATFSSFKVPLCPFCSAPQGFRSKRELFLEEHYRKEFSVCHLKGRIPAENGGQYDLDLFFPEKNVAFEMNGVYFHSSLFKSKYYHRDKTQAALRQGIRLYHIWESVPDNKVLAFMDNILGKFRRVLDARKTSVKILSPQDREEFFITNHFMGETSAFLALGLFHVSELVSAMSFRSSSSIAEIARYSSILGTRVRGGFSKLLNHALSQLKSRGFRKLVTYADRDLSPSCDQTVYAKVGFTSLGDSGPILRFSDGHKVWDRHTFMRHKLKIPGYLEKVLEREIVPCHDLSLILPKNKVYAIFNSGNWKYELNLST
jgi:hypothetical protein